MVRDAESIFFEDQLTANKSTVVDVVYPRAKLYNGLIPINTDIDPADTQFRYEQYESSGMAKLVANYATDFPTVQLSAAEFFTPIRSFGDSFIVNKAELRAAAKTGKDVTSKKLKVAKEVIDLKLEDVILKYRAANKDHGGLTGLLYSTNVTKGTVATRNGHVTFSSKTADEMLADLIAGATGIISLTLGNEQPNTVLLPIDQYNLIMTTKMSVYDQTTVAQAFKNACPYITTIDWIVGLDAVNPIPSTLAASSTDCMVFFDRNPDKLEFLLPLPFEVNDPEREGLTYKTMCEARCGGVVVYKPLSISIVEGI